MGGTQIRLPGGGGLSPSGVVSGGRSCRATWRKASKRKSRTLPPGWLPGPGWSPGCAGWCRRCGGTARPVPRVSGGAAVPLRGCVGRRVRPVRRGGAGCDGGGGVGWGGWSSLSRVGSGDGVSFGGRGRGDSRWRVSAGASTSIGWCWLPRVASVAWSRGGAGGGGGVGVALLVVGGAGVDVVVLGVWASLWVVWVLRVCAVRSLRFLTGCCAGVWVGGGRMGVRVGL